ncbi:hypothetical protein LIER_39386 [Lithospermum erythrorhizon]|uniref:No apical meristem-associated C-terminal domain-containing protein n=1 Tax=Lithospermum erythrorhizon TaxID=34254 RepID=A0AAV3QH16_LITER
MPYGYQPAPGNNYVSSPNMNHLNTDPNNYQNTPHFSSGSTDIPEFSSQVSLRNADGDTPHSFVPETQELGKRTQYASWSTEENKVLLTGYFLREAGWSDDDYMSRSLELYSEKENTMFTLVDEWKLVRHQPRYNTGANEYGSSGSKRKSSEDSSVPLLVRPEGRDAAKKKSKAIAGKSSTSRKSKISKEQEFSNLSTVRENFEKSRESIISAMLEYASSQKEVARTKKLEMWMILKNKEDRDDEDEEAYNMLKNDLFGHCLFV